MVDVWSTLTDEQRQRIETGNVTYRRIKSGETLERWYEIALGVDEIQRVALSWSNSASTNSRAYQQAWRDLVEHAPEYDQMDKGERSHCVWLVAHWDSVFNWWKKQPVNVRLSLNHPRSVRRRYEDSLKPPPNPGDTNGSKEKPRIKMQDRIADLQEKLDAALKMRTSGAMPAGMKAEDYADMIADQMA